MNVCEWKWLIRWVNEQIWLNTCVSTLSYYPSWCMCCLCSFVGGLVDKMFCILNQDRNTIILFTHRIDASISCCQCYNSINCFFSNKMRLYRPFAYVFSYLSDFFLLSYWSVYSWLAFPLGMKLLLSNPSGLFVGLEIGTVHWIVLWLTWMFGTRNSLSWMENV